MRDDPTRPLDPTQDAQDLMNDTSGITGVTQDHTGTKTISQKELHNTSPSKDGPNPANSGSVSRSMSGSQYKRALDIAEGVDSELTEERKKVQSDQDIDNTKIPNDQPENEGMQSVSGTASSPNSDRDTDEMRNDVGLATPDQDRNDPKQLDVASDLDDNEEYFKSH